ncbi:ribonuclease H-like domain-containing protein [Tanacetum coccineum]
MTILNTLDPLGKFDGKADEGLLVGYSINSKAFKIINTRTRKVEENMHITFLENKPNVTGSGPDWLFDIDLLTNSMNYEPVTAGNQTNVNAEDAVADDAGKKTTEEPANEGERNGQEKEGGASNKEGDQNVQDLRAELDKLLCHMMKNDVGAEADLNNLETTMNVSPIPTTRIHKDHPKEQIIGDPLLAPQTRRMTKSSQEHAMFRLQKVWRLVDLPKGKHAIGTKWVYRNKKDKRGIVVRNKARLVAQGYTQEEGINYDEVCSKSKDDGIFISQDKYMDYILKKIDFATVKTASTLIETNKALLKDEEAEDVDQVSKLLQSLTSSCSTEDLRYMKDHPKLAFRAKRGRDTEIPQSGGPLDKVGDEAVHKELGDIVERATTTTASLDAEQDSGNILKTQSTAIPNVPLSQEIGTGWKHTVEVMSKDLDNMNDEYLYHRSRRNELNSRRQRSLYATVVSKYYQQEEEDLVAEDPSKQGRSLIEEMDLDVGISLVSSTWKAKNGDEIESPTEDVKRERVQISRDEEVAQSYNKKVAVDEDFVQQLQAGEKCSEEDLPMKLVELVNQ